MGAAAPTTVIPAPYRHSGGRLPSFPRKRESRRYCLRMVLPPNRRRIPAYAGMTVGGGREWTVERAATAALLPRNSAFYDMLGIRVNTP